jgi:ADP-ribose pyrophosphatase YjhB (NUDIX family)
MYCYAFPRPSVTATIVIFGMNSGHAIPPNHFRLLTGIRGRSDGAYAGYRCAPGGFLNAKIDPADVVFSEGEGLLWAQEWEPGDEPVESAPGETIEETAIREVFEETGIQLRPEQLRLSHVHSDPNTDPRAHVVNVCYYVVLSDATLALAVAGDDLADLELIVVDADNIPTMAFNHADIVRRAYSNWTSEFR